MKINSKNNIKTSTGVISFENIKNRLLSDTGIRYRKIRTNSGIIQVIYTDNLCDTKFISHYVIMPIMDNLGYCDDIDYVREEIIFSSSVGDVSSDEDAINHILSGDVVVLFMISGRAFYCEAKGFPKRAIEVPTEETVIKGPREGFTEIITDNISAIRRRIKTPDLKFEQMTIGSKSQTDVIFIYIQGVAPESLVKYVKQKISEVKTDFAIYSNYIEVKLKNENSAFDTIGYTEKPDKAANRLTEGRIVILVNGTPFAIIAPYFFLENFQASDDYTLNKFMASAGRIIRWISFLASTLLPGIYIALFAYHFNLVPYIYVFRMAESRAGVPFPLVVEVLIMIYFFQGLREAAVRLPQQIGPTLSIVGALILGEAAVRSGLTSQVTVLIVALTSIASFLVPKIAFAIFKWNLILIFFSSFLGLPGFFMGFVLFVANLAGLTSCGYPYLYPLGTLTKFKYKDIILRGDLMDVNQYIFKSGGGK